HHVVPPIGQHRDRLIGQVWMLLGEQPPEQRRGDVHLSGWHRLPPHYLSVGRIAGKPMGAPPRAGPAPPRALRAAAGGRRPAPAGSQRREWWPRTPGRR